MATNKTPPQSLEQSLELRILKFPVDRNSPDSSPHDAVKNLLIANGRFGHRFRYGSADSNLLTDEQLRERGVADSQPRASDGSLVLYLSIEDVGSYCGRDFFNGKKVIVVYDKRMLEQTLPRSYWLLSHDAVVAIVMPTFTRQDSLPQEHASQ